MKSKSYLPLLLASLCLPMVSCDDKDNDKDPERNQLVLTPSAQEVTLTETDDPTPVLTFSWNTATDLGSEYSFTYPFQVDIADNNFASATEVEIVEPNGSYSFSAGELYNLIVEKWGRTAGQPARIEARVAARVDGPYFKYPEIATAITTVTTFVPVSRPLYITGSATPGGTDLNAATGITELSNGRLYSWRGRLVPGTFKFITEPGQEFPSYNMGDDSKTLVQRNDASQPDKQFEAYEEGTYSIYLSLTDMTISYAKVMFEHLYLVGNGTMAGWELDKLIEMNPDPSNPNIFTYNGPLMEGEIKIISEREWNVPTVKPLKADADINSDTEVQITPGQDPDYKWKVTAEQAGTYKITLDLEKLTINFEKQ